MAGFTVLFGSMLQIPLSTTHCKVSLLKLFKSRIDGIVKLVRSN